MVGGRSTANLAQLGGSTDSNFFDACARLAATALPATHCRKQLIYDRLIVYHSIWVVLYGKLKDGSVQGAGEVREGERFGRRA